MSDVVLETVSAMDPKPDSSLELSLLICTRNRASQLARTLSFIQGIRTRARWELIVVDNDSDDQTSSVVREFAGNAGHPVQLIVKEGRGVSGAKNVGWRSAKAPVVVCIDDDCYPEPNFLDVVMARFSSDPRLGFLGGRILLYDPTDRRITIQESLEPWFFPPRSFIRPGIIQGANVAYRRAALEEVEGFDPWFGAGALYSGDETELLARISAAGWNGAYHPDPVVYHHHGRKTARDEWRLMRWYDRGRGAYYAKCILNKRMRNLYIRNWFGTRQHHSWRTSTLEIISGLEYVARSFITGRLLFR